MTSLADGLLITCSVYFQVVAYLGPEARKELEQRGARPWTIRQQAGQVSLRACLSLSSHDLSFPVRPSLFLQGALFKCAV